eukprot:COSAG01_NODE_775_length_13698_cov_60.191632_5_plen_121_part_00
MQRKALLVIDHGSRKQAANDMIFEVVKRLKAKRSDIIIEGAHMELADPDIPAGIAACVAAGATDILVQPFMLSPGRHSTKDIPDIVQACKEKYPQVAISTGTHMGLHPLLLDALLTHAGV